MKFLHKGYLYERIDLSNPIKGGVGDTFTPELGSWVKGAIIEKEHVGDLNNESNLSKALDIARDHLKESPDYYKALSNMEEKLGIG
jgi:hypothetical protein